MFMMQLFAGKSMTPCMPKEEAIDVARARQLFSDYLTKNPRAQSNSAGLVIGMAIAEAFPCQQQRK
jgi:hypothetical protein